MKKPKGTPLAAVEPGDYVDVDPGDDIKVTALVPVEPPHDDTILRVPVRRLDPDMPLPSYQTAGAAGLDLIARKQVHIEGNAWAVIPTGLSVEIPHGYVGFVCSRSGMAAKRGMFVLNAPGIIDSDYTMGEVQVILYNPGTVHTINRGDRIAQFLIMPVARVELVEGTVARETERGSNGLGSTGV